jgi:hypothetical protein
VRQTRNDMCGAVLEQMLAPVPGITLQAEPETIQPAVATPCHWTSISMALHRIVSNNR